MCDDKDKKLYIQSCKLNLKNNFFIPGGSVFQTPLFAAILVQRFATPLRVAFQIAISVAVATRHSAPRAVLVLDVVIPVWDPRSVFPVSLILKKLNHWFLLWLVFFYGNRILLGALYFWEGSLLVLLQRLCNINKHESRFENCNFRGCFQQMLGAVGSLQI